jgi:hypothetical protein
MDISSSASSLGVVKTGGGRERDVLFGASGCGRLSVGNTHGSCWGTRHSRWSQACRPWSVNPSRKLRRFESFTWHHVLERADQWKRLGGDPFIYLVGVSMPAWLSRSHGVRPQVCDLHKRGRADGRRRRLWEYVRKFGSTPRAGRTRPKADHRRCRVWGMQRWWTFASSRLGGGGESRVRAEPSRCSLISVVGRSCQIRCQAGVNCAARRACAGIFTVRVLWGTSSRAQPLTSGVVARRSATGTVGTTRHAELRAFG